MELEWRLFQSSHKFFADDDQTPYAVVTIVRQDSHNSGPLLEGIHDCNHASVMKQVSALRRPPWRRAQVCVPVACFHHKFRMVITARVS
jgi:hypothetical protein